MANPADTNHVLRIGVRELRGNLTRTLRQVREGASVLVTSHGAVIAELHPPTPEHLAPRQFGLLRGQVWMADDFDALPEDVLAAMEG